MRKRIAVTNANIKPVAQQNCFAMYPKSSSGRAWPLLLLRFLKLQAEVFPLHSKITSWISCGTCCSQSHAALSLKCLFLSIERNCFFVFEVSFCWVCAKAAPPAPIYSLVREKNRAGKTFLLLALWLNDYFLITVSVIRYTGFLWTLRTKKRICTCKFCFTKSTVNKAKLQFTNPVLHFRWAESILYTTWKK